MGRCNHKIVVLVMAFIITACSDNTPDAASALPANNFIAGTEFEPAELPFSQHEERKLPLKTAGFWHVAEEEDYIFISLNGVQTNYLHMRHEDCYRIRGPHQVRYYGKNRYTHTSRRDKQTQIEFQVERTSKKGRVISASTAGPWMQYNRVNDMQPEDLNICKSSRRKNHPYGT